MLREFIPKSFLYLKSGYTFSIFRKDLFAGLTVGIIALPLAMAFAISSGVTPDRGLFTAIIAGFLISALGGSRAQIGGPTGAFVVIIYDIIQRTGYEGLAVSTLLAAIILILLGIFRLGSWIKYIPYPLVTGFTTAIAVIIFSSQMKDFFGLRMENVPAGFIEKWGRYLAEFYTFHTPTLLLGFATFTIILILRKFVPKVPWGLAAVVFATLISTFFNLHVETIQSKFGQIPSSLPHPSLPSLFVPQSMLSEVFMDALTIAFLAAIESLLSAVIADGMMGSRHQSNCELIGQGIANFASIVFGGIPATGAIARTAANIKSGGQTPMAGMIHAAILFLIILFLAPLVSKIPLTALSAILIVVAWNMSEAGHFIRLLKAQIGDVAILLTAFTLTLLVDITVAVMLGMILASFVFMKRMSEYSKTVSLTKLFQEPTSDFFEKYDPDSVIHKNVPSGVEIYELQGPFFFAVTHILKDLLKNLEKSPKVFILRMRFVPLIDSSGMHALKEFYFTCKRSNTILLLSGVKGQTEKDLSRFELRDLIGQEYIFSHIDHALEKAESILKESLNYKN